MSRSDQSGEKAYTEDVAATYEEDRRVEAFWEEEQAYVTGVAARAAPGARVLDIPVGTGRFLDIYQARGLRVLGLDISSAMLEQAARRARSPDVELALGNATMIAAADRSFDLVICWRLLHLLPPDELGAVVAELVRVCGGRLHVQAYVRDRWYWWLRLRKLLARFLPALTGTSARRAPPWRHIRSYAHAEKPLLACFLHHGAQLERSETLGVDGALRVKAYSFSRR